MSLTAGCIVAPNESFQLTMYIRLVSGLNPETGATIAEHAEAHSSPINRICTLLQGQIATGDDDGVIKLWDPRAWGSAKGKEPVREYRHHWEYISDLLFEEERRQLLTTR